MTEPQSSTHTSDLRRRIHEIIFKADTPAGKAFDIALLWTILLSVLTVMLDSVADISVEYGRPLRILEWVFTLLFTAEYFLRIYCSPRPGRYIRSFFGLVDLVSILPTYLSFFIAGSQSLLVIRALRLLRVFRILNLAQYRGESHVLLNALKASRHKITVFLGAVLMVVLIMGATMYLIEGKEHGFDSIPTSMYWAVVTMTTVGYGDIAPQTVIGQVLASVLMILGYGIIAVPTGIVSAELVRSPVGDVRKQACPACETKGHDFDATHCKHCGAKL